MLAKARPTVADVDPWPFNPFAAHTPFSARAWQAGISRWCPASYGRHIDRGLSVHRHCWSERTRPVILADQASHAARLAGTIRNVDVRTAAVTLVVAAIGAGAGFIGGFLSARWQARNDLAQWRRDRLLQFCADLLAAGAELEDVARTAAGGEEVPYPREAFNHIRLARSRVMLLSEELGDIAFAFTKAAMELAVEGRRRPLDLQSFLDMAGKLGQSQGRFLRAAHNHLRDYPSGPSPWRTVWTRVPASVRKVVAKVAAARKRAAIDSHGTASTEAPGGGAPRDTTGLP